MRLPKGSNKNFVDKTAISPREQYFNEWLSQQPSSQSGLDPIEQDMQDAGWTPRDLYFLRAAQADSELVPNKGATYTEAGKAEYLKRIMFERIMHNAYRKRQMKR